MPEPPRPLEPPRQVGAPARPPVRTASHFKPPPLTHRLQVRPVSVVQHHLPADANQKPNSQAHRQSLHTQHLPAFFPLAAKKDDGCQLQSVPFLPVRRQHLLASINFHAPPKETNDLHLRCRSRHLRVRRPTLQRLPHSASPQQAVLHFILVCI